MLARLARLAELDAEHAEALVGGGPKYTERHRQRGKLTARERIELLVDPDSPFLELRTSTGRWIAWRRSSAETTEPGRGDASPPQYGFPAGRHAPVTRRGAAGISLLSG